MLACMYVCGCGGDFYASTSFACSCVHSYVRERLLWFVYTRSLAVILHDVWGMSNIQAGTKAEQKQWGGEIMAWTSVSRPDAVQVSPHKNCTSCSGLSIAYEAGYKCESVQSFVHGVCMCAIIGANGVGLCVRPVDVWAHMVVSVTFGYTSVHLWC